MFFVLLAVFAFTLMTSDESTGRFSTLSALVEYLLLV